MKGAKHIAAVDGSFSYVCVDWLKAKCLIETHFQSLLEWHDSIVSWIPIYFLFYRCSNVFCLLPVKIILVVKKLKRSPWQISWHFDLSNGSFGLKFGLFILELCPFDYCVHVHLTLFKAKPHADLRKGPLCLCLTANSKPACPPTWP